MIILLKRTCWKEASKVCYNGSMRRFALSLAVFVTINSSGVPIWHVLGTETQITVKNVASSAYSSDSQIALSNEGGKVSLNGMDVSNFKGDLVEIEARGDANDIKIGQDGGRFALSEKGIVANTDFPIIINPTKNELTLSTPTGNRLISVWPYEATLILTRAKMIDGVKENKINLEESSNGELEYKINGEKNVNLFNIVNIKADVAATVSATTGEVLNLDEPQWLKFFGFVFK